MYDAVIMYGVMAKEEVGIRRTIIYSSQTCGGMVVVSGYGFILVLATRR